MQNLIKNMSVTFNESGQIKVTGTITLRQSAKLFSDGVSGKWETDAFLSRHSVTVPSGTIVDYELLETRSGFYHTVSLKTSDGVFSSARRADQFLGREPWMTPKRSLLGMVIDWMLVSGNACGRVSALEVIYRVSGESGIFYFALAHGVLVNGSAEEFATEFYTAYNAIYPGTY